MQSWSKYQATAGFMGIKWPKSTQTGLEFGGQGGKKAQTEESGHAVGSSTVLRWQGRWRIQNERLWTVLQDWKDKCVVLVGTMDMNQGPDKEAEPLMDKNWAVKSHPDQSSCASLKPEGLFVSESPVWSSWYLGARPGPRRGRMADPRDAQKLCKHRHERPPYDFWWTYFGDLNSIFHFIWHLSQFHLIFPHACVLSHFNCVWLCVTPWAVARQAPLSMGFSRQEYWSGWPWPPPGELPNPGIEPMSLT